MFNDSSESDCSSSDEDDLDLILLDCLFPSANHGGPLLSIDDLSDWQCEKMFRQVFKTFTTTSYEYWEPNTI